jgi:hypothetical protein
LEFRIFIEYRLFVSFILAAGWQKRLAFQAETWAEPWAGSNATESSIWSGEFAGHISNFVVRRISLPPMRIRAKYAFDGL